MSMKHLTAAVLFAAMVLGQSGAAMAAACKTTSVQGWGLTEEMAKWQANDMLLLSTGNLLTQTSKMSKPSHKCSSSLLGWTCTATAKVCKK